jgi:hypothetical protein
MYSIQLMIPASPWFSCMAKPVISGVCNVFAALSSSS